MTQDQVYLRKRWGCDDASDIPTYLITCPKCDGSTITDSKERCDVCIPAGPRKGMKEMSRCPCSQTTREISDALRAYSWKEGGALPEGGGVLDQSPTYLQFCGVVSSETARVQREEMENR